MAASSDKLEKFKRARTRCVDQYRALTSLGAAYGYAASLINGWDTNNSVVASALHSAMVIAYSRPFSPSKTSKGNLQYPINDLKKLAPPAAS